MNSIASAMRGPRIWIAFLAIACCAASTSAQPALQFHRFVDNWPTIRLYYTVKCGGQTMYVSEPPHLDLRENGVPVTNFSVSCPDPPSYAAFSVALAADVSAGMAGAPLDAAKAGMHAFVDSMDGVQDEAAVILVNDQPAVMQSMTTNVELLHLAISAMAASGEGSFLNRASVGVTEVVAHAHNAYRALVAITDGDPYAGNSEAWTDLTVFAIANHVRIFPIAYGNDINTASLESTAQLTGGTFHHATDPAQLPGIYREIVTFIHRGFEECSIFYTAACGDGTVRTADLSVFDVCGGNDTQTNSSRTPRDTATFGLYDVLVRRVFDRSLPVAAGATYRVRLADAPHGLYTLLIRAENGDICGASASNETPLLPVGVREPRSGSICLNRSRYL